MGKNVSKFDEEFITNYDEDTNKGYIFKVDVKYPKDFHDLHSDLQFLTEKNKINKCDKHVVHIRFLKQALNHGLILKKYIE